jgi:hypothetical protein
MYKNLKFGNFFFKLPNFFQSDGDLLYQLEVFGDPGALSLQLLVLRLELVLHERNLGLALNLGSRLLFFCLGPML